jgi:peroxiredoxin Q/BCP
MTALTTLKPGDKAPDFKAESTDGSFIALHHYAGKSNVVLYFYPEDMTSGCTIEACNFRDDNAAFKSANTVILGVSLDSREKHQQFTEKDRLNFPLLVDTSREICTAYGVPVDGHQPHRWTFLIDKNGTIAKIYDKVNVREHSKQLLADIANLPK